MATTARRDLPGLAPSTLTTPPELGERYREARPFPHLVIDGFLEPTLLHRLLTEFPPTEAATAIDDFGRDSRKFACRNVREIGPAFRELDDLVASSELRDLVTSLTGIPGLLYDPSYFGGGTHESLDGQLLHPHLDFNYHPETHHHRRVNMIVFLNEEWDERWGGLLELRADARDRGDGGIVIPPIANRCVLFATTERSWHGHSRVRTPTHQPEITRKSFAWYYYSLDRPPSETVPPHSTVYAPRRPSATDLDDETRELIELYERLLVYHQDRQEMQMRSLDEMTDRVHALVERSQLVEIAAGIPFVGPIGLADASPTAGTVPVDFRVGLGCSAALARIEVTGTRIPKARGAAEITLLASDGRVVGEPVPSGAFTVVLDGPFPAGTAFELRVRPTGDDAEPDEPFVMLAEIRAVSPDA